MATPIQMPVPICLIENNSRKGLVVQQEALKVLSEIRQPVVVVGITGLYRTGKSYLMNRLAGQRKGFSMGSGVQSHTKGIWMWCVPHPCQPGRTLVLLDTEGLGDVEKGDTKNDTWIFVLTVLLSSTLIYNSKGIIDQQALDQLHYVMKLAERVKWKAAPEETEDELEASEQLVPFFPTFVWAVRDFTLQLEKDGKEISEDEYLESALKLETGDSPETKRFNQPRECIHQFFPNRKCFIFDQPASRSDLVRLEELQDNELNCDFQEQVQKFCSHIWEKSPPKTIPGGHILTGNLLGKLAETYVEAVQSGTVPCLESAVRTLAERENTAAVKQAMKLYWDQMEQRAKLPTDTAEELVELHNQCKQEALGLFRERAFEDSISQFQAELMHQLKAAKEKFRADNEQASLARCRAALRKLFQDIESRLKDGVYSVTGGFQLFQADLQALVKNYREMPGKGVKAEAVLQQFLQDLKTLVEMIRLIDDSLKNKDEELKSKNEQLEETEQKWKKKMKIHIAVSIGIGIVSLAFPPVRALRFLKVPL